MSPLAVDYVTPGKFYLFANNNIYVSTNCSTWTSVYSGFTTNNYLVELKSVPGNAGHLFFAQGPGSTTNTSLATVIASHPNAISFYFSANGGSTWTALTNSRRC